MAEEKLQRFISAQEDSYSRALSELKTGRKRTHWMWYIFPQIKGLGQSETSRFYAITDAAEATSYLQHPVLGNRLVEISRTLLELKEKDPVKIFGKPDDLKLKSSMTLFASLADATPVFNEVLEKFFDGERDSKTLKILESEF